MEALQALVAESCCGHVPHQCWPAGHAQSNFHTQVGKPYQAKERGLLLPLYHLQCATTLLWAKLSLVKLARQVTASGISIAAEPRTTSLSRLQPPIK